MTLSLTRNLQHSVICRAGEDTETVVCALFHDVGELLSPVCHGEIGQTWRDAHVVRTRSNFNKFAHKQDQ